MHIAWGLMVVPGSLFICWGSFGFTIEASRKFHMVVVRKKTSFCIVLYTGSNVFLLICKGDLSACVCVWVLICFWM